MSSYLEQLFWDSRHVELRHQTGDRWVTGWFDNADALHREAASRQKDGNLFTSLHHPFSRVVSNSMSGAALGNDDVESFTRLFFDFDPVRPTDTPSTDEQLGLAKAKAAEVAKVLHLLGWPEPLQALSGNGWHLQYRVAVSNTEEARQRLKVLYTGLGREFSNEQVKFDTAVRNPARICTLYGTVKRKGSDPSKYRQSQVWIPRDWRQIRSRHFDAVTDFYDRKQIAQETYHPSSVKIDGDGDYNTLDAVAWFTAHGQYHRSAGEPGKHWVRCPWEDEHSDGINAQMTDTVVWEADGNWPTFHCSHAHCEGRDIKDVMNEWGDADQFCSDTW